MCRPLFWLVLTIACVSCQIGGIGGLYGGGMYGGGMYGTPYGIGAGLHGLGMGMGTEMLNSPYGYASYYYRCKNPFWPGGAYNPTFGNMMGKRRK